MKYNQITLVVKNASRGQMLSIRGELNLMSKSWKSYGPDIEVKGRKLQEPKAHPTKHIRLW
tara:strand:+ start:553 stop:735 length:183 start_codon:yes stop_codon:yes gene_type:complete